MTDLKAHTPAVDLLPIAVGGIDLTEVDLGALYLVMPFEGQTQTVSAKLRQECGVGFAAPNERLSEQGVQSIWFGYDTCLLAGASKPPDLSGVAAVTDQSDAWAAVALAGTGAEDVLARLVPVDLRASAFSEGATARTLLGHMNASISRIGPESFLILVFRSMAQTLVHELKEAMEAVAARG